MNAKEFELYKAYSWAQEAISDRLAYLTNAGDDPCPPDLLAEIRAERAEVERRYSESYAWRGMGYESWEAYKAEAQAEQAWQAWHPAFVIFPPTYGKN
jgi:hypothetical protein